MSHRNGPPTRFEEVIQSQRRVRCRALQRLRDGTFRHSRCGTPCTPSSYFRAVRVAVTAPWESPIWRRFGMPSRSPRTQETGSLGVASSAGGGMRRRLRATRGSTITGTVTPSARNCGGRPGGAATRVPPLSGCSVSPRRRRQGSAPRDARLAGANGGFSGLPLPLPVEAAVGGPRRAGSVILSKGRRFASAPAREDAPGAPVGRLLGRRRTAGGRRAARVSLGILGGRRVVVLCEVGDFGSPRRPSPNSFVGLNGPVSSHRCQANSIVRCGCHAPNSATACPPSPAVRPRSA